MSTSPLLKKQKRTARPIPQNPYAKLSAEAQTALKWVDTPNRMPPFLFEDDWSATLAMLVDELMLDSVILPYEDDYSWEFCEQDSFYSFADGRLRLLRNGRSFDEMGGYIADGTLHEWEWQINDNGQWRVCSYDDTYAWSYLANLCEIAFLDESFRGYPVDQDAFISELDTWYAIQVPNAVPIPIPAPKSYPKPKTVREIENELLASAAWHDKKQSSALFGITAVAIIALFAILLIIALL